MRYKSIEDIAIKHIENGIRSIKLGTKTPDKVEINKWLDRLKDLNEGMFLDLQTKYVLVVKDYKIKTDFNKNKFGYYK
jgi:hypothetical protein